jgi:phenylpropionate dioxygenase-like ring-hydroxylating dioxygenase large terminal subunit
MSRQHLVAMARANLAHVAAGTIPQEPDVFRVPAANYTDPDRFAQEVAQVFRRLPLMLGFTAEVPAPGDYKAMTVAGTPVLLTRGGDGVLHAFVNMCSHRGAVLVEDGTGSARRFTCPYHAWSYDQEGTLVGILSRDDFGEVDTTCLGLTPLAVTERHGLIFVTLTPGAGLDVDRFLCGYGELLAHFGFEAWHVVSQRSIAGPNWKVAYDGYLDLYHLPILHRNTFGPNISNQAIYHAWGPHQRVTSPNPKLEKLLDRPEEDWPIESLISGVWTIFPHVSIASFEAGGRGALVSQLFPGPQVGTSITIQNYLVEQKPEGEELELALKQADFLEHVVRDEDYATGLKIQLAATTGAKSEFLFGRNEGGGHRFHGWVDRILASDDDALATLFPPR